jgi:hypothetical protein
MDEAVKAPVSLRKEECLALEQGYAAKDEKAVRGRVLVAGFVEVEKVHGVSKKPVARSFERATKGNRLSGRTSRERRPCQSQAKA